jgi:uncharacterized membrane protein HdeD (DUF308 family)
MQGVHFAASALLGALLLLLRRPLGRWLHPNEATVNPVAQPLFAAGVALIGVHYVVSGLVSLSEYFEWRRSGVDQPYTLWSGGTSVVLGAILFAASPGISRLLRRLFEGARRAA